MNGGICIAAAGGWLVCLLKVVFATTSAINIRFLSFPKYELCNRPQKIKRHWKSSLSADFQPNVPLTPFSLNPSHVHCLGSILSAFISKTDCSVSLGYLPECIVMYICYQNVLSGHRPVNASSIPPALQLETCEFIRFVIKNCKKRIVHWE